MSGEIQQDIAVVELLENTILQILQKNGLLQGNKTFGTIYEILNDTTLMVDMTQSNSIERVRCSPNVEFFVGDRVLVEYINNNPHDMFVMAVVSGGVQIDGEDEEECPEEVVFPYEPVEIIRYDDERRQAYLFIYGYDDPKTTWEQELVRNSKNQVVEIIHRYPNDVILIRELLRNEFDEVYKYE